MMFSTKAEYGVRVMAHLARERRRAARWRSAPSPTPRGCRSPTSSTWCSGCAAPSSWSRAAAPTAATRSPGRPRRSRWPRSCAALEGDIAPIECITADADGALVCAREGDGDGPCPTKLLWTRVQGSIVRTLNDMTLADLVRPLAKTKEKLTA